MPHHSNRALAALAATFLLAGAALAQGPAEYEAYLRLGQHEREAEQKNLKQSRSLRKFTNGFEAWKRTKTQEELLKVLLGELPDAQLVVAWNRLSTRDQGFHYREVGRALEEVRKRLGVQPADARQTEPAADADGFARLLRMTEAAYKEEKRSAPKRGQAESLERDLIRWLSSMSGRDILHQLFGVHLSDAELMAAWDALSEGDRQWYSHWLARSNNEASRTIAALKHDLQEEENRVRGAAFERADQPRSARLTLRVYEHALSWMAFNPRNDEFGRGQWRWYTFLSGNFGSGGHRSRSMPSGSERAADIELPSTVLLDHDGFTVLLPDGTLRTAPVDGTSWFERAVDPQLPKFRREADLAKERERRRGMVQKDLHPQDALGLADVFCDPVRWPWHAVRPATTIPPEFEGIGRPDKGIAQAEQYFRPPFPRTRNVWVLPSPYHADVDATRLYFFSMFLQLTRPGLGDVAPGRDPVASRDEAVHLDVFDGWGRAAPRLSLHAADLGYSQLAMEALSIDGAEPRRERAGGPVHGYAAVLQDRYLLFSRESLHHVLDGAIEGLPGRVPVDVFDLERGRVLTTAARVVRPQIDLDRVFVLAPPRLRFAKAMPFLLHGPEPGTQRYARVLVRPTQDEEQVELVVELGEELLPRARRVETMRLDLVQPNRLPALLRLDAEGAWWAYPSVRQTERGAQSTYSLVFVPLAADGA
ncbi:MAG: hypothetical protein R3F56_01155 [Planctomycetota bacterium]